MREIKFRCWCEANKEMYFPDGNYYFFFDNTSVGFFPRYNCEELQHFNTSPAEHEKEIIVMQYTGLKDKNGKEIYEGDLLRVCDNNNGNFLVEFKNAYVGGWVLTNPISENYISLGGRKSTEVEIIGNIFKDS